MIYENEDLTKNRSKLILIIFVSSKYCNLSMKLINPLLIIRILSTILLIETISYLFCLPVVFIYKESPYPFLWSAAVTLFLSAIFYFISREADSDKFSNRDGFLAVTLSWVIFSLLGALPYLDKWYYSFIY